MAAAGLTVAVKGWGAVDRTVAVIGRIDTPVGTGVMVIVAEADFVVSAAEVAVSVIVAGLGTFGGAV